VPSCGHAKPPKRPGAETHLDRKWLLTLLFSKHRREDLAVAENRLYSVASIAKLLDVPESTLHYWKNRFDDVLPSIGRGRNKRFRPEALDVFRDIGAMLGQGLSCADVRAELARRYPVNVATTAAAAEPVQAVRVTEEGAGHDGALAVATRIGTEIAKTLLTHLHQQLAPAPAALPGETAAGLQSELDRVRSENAALTEKMQLLEAELVRLRKDRRELETYLVDKINALTRTGQTG
jgi:DNA-binding transcriptional MerR regulator